MSGKPVKTSYDALTCRIIGAAMAVHRQLRPGYRENTYQRDLEVHFSESGLAYVAQKNIEVYDTSGGNVLIGYYIPQKPNHRRLLTDFGNSLNGWGLDGLNPFGYCQGR